MEKQYIIVEDEPFARQLLAEMISELRPQWRQIFAASSVADAVAYFSSGATPDICFMDIELGDGNIFELFNRVRVDTPVIFTTAYDHYSLEAFKANSISYVLKPIDIDELREAIEKYERTHPRVADMEMLYNRLMSHIPSSAPREMPARILTAVGDRYGFEYMDNVAWFVREDKYVYIVTRDGRKSVTTLRSLDEADELTDPAAFFRLSRKVICSIDAVDNIYRHFKGRLRVTLKAGKLSMEETVSAERRNDFLRWVGYGPV